MSDSIPSHLLAQIAALVASLTGLHFSNDRRDDLVRGICSAAIESGYSDTEAFIHRLLASPPTRDQITSLASHLTIGETVFFREKGCFDVLEKNVLPELISSRLSTGRHLRIWSAGCSTGEEPYSIAILLSKLFLTASEWKMTILATDINSHVLKKAMEGVYTEWAFRNTPLWVKERYFTRTENGRYELLPAIRKMVSFEYLNLAEDVYPSLFNNTNGMDVIFCRNVLMYFSPDRVEKVIQSFCNSLVDGGRLFVSPTDTSPTLASRFSVVHESGMVYYQKRGQLESMRREGATKGVDGVACGETHRGKNAALDNRFLPPQNAGPSFAGLADAVAAGSPAPGKAGKGGPMGQDKPYYEEATALYRRGRYAEAAGMLAVPLSQGGEDPRDMLLMARVCANQGRLAGALEWCEKAVAADMLNPGGHYLLATVSLELGRTEDAVRSLKKALYLAPDFALAYFVLGNLLQKQGESGTSMKCYRNALDISATYNPDEILPESDGMTAGRFTEIVEAMAGG